jgi:Family of unknown function (DUF695)
VEKYMWPFKKRHPEVPTEGVSESWSMFQGEDNGKPLIARANVGLKPFVGHPRYAHQIGVAIPLRAPDENGFPSSDESAELTDIEDKLCAELTGGNESLFAAVITTGGMREFVFYTSDSKSAELKLKKISETILTHTLQGMIRDDKEWSVYRQFV